jgi:DNA-directed RNA polymerase subunit N (RpoN/RPB10)
MDVNTFPKPKKRWEDKDYRNMVRKKRCFACGHPAPSYAHHVTWAEARGMSRKVSDFMCISLCFDCHGAIHNPVGKHWNDIKANLSREDTLSEIVKNMGGWIRGER